MRNFKLLLNFIKGNGIMFVGAGLSVCIAAIFSTLLPLVIKTVIDSIIGDKPMDLPLWVVDIIQAIGGRGWLVENLWICGLVIIVFTGMHGLFLYLKGRLVAMTSENSAKSLREKIYVHILHLPSEYHSKSHAGDLIQRCTSDIETVQGFISGHLIEIVQSLLSFAMVIVIMLYQDWLYTLVSIALVPFILAATTIFFTKMKEVFKETDESEGRLTSTLQENLTGVRVVKAFGAQSLEMRKFDEKNMEYRDNIYRILKLMSNFWSSTDFLCLLQFGTVLVMGIYWINIGRITLGTMVAFTSYSGMLIWPVRQLGQMLAFMGQAFVSLNRIQEILDHPVEPSAGNEIKPEIKGEIEFDNVWFNYSDGSSVLKGLSLKIKKGETVAFLGATGSGKSSIAHLLIRLYDCQKGTIRIDGTDISKIDRKWLRKHVGIVLQEPFLFSKTIKENIRFGRPEAGESDIYESASIACIHESILGFEKGYDTVIGERGVTLSGGQRQRLAIARAVIRDVPILIFDDSLSAVDMETDAAIRKALRQRSSNTTTIIISHRITTLAEADTIFVLEDGIIKQSGTHEELIKQDGLYKRVWELQSSLESELEDVM